MAPELVQMSFPDKLMKTIQMLPKQKNTINLWAPI